MLLADCGYDADWMRALAARKGALANIPPISNRIEPIRFSLPFGEQKSREQAAPCFSITRGLNSR